MYIQYDSLLTDTSQMLCGDDTKVPVLNPELWHSATAHAAWVVASHTQVFSHEHMGFSRVPSEVMRVVVCANPLETRLANRHAAMQVKRIINVQRLENEAV
eukprot:m.221101 g.221101  ORF g.221101 m.221101 type:complete len:101 (-) comp15125_c0_seq1:177-479(-)